MRKTIKLWQMLVMTGLLLGIVISMFIPVYQITAKKLTNITIQIIKMVGEETSKASDDEDDWLKSSIYKMMQSSTGQETIEKEYEKILENYEGDMPLSCSGFDLIRGKLIQGDTRKQVEEVMEKDVDDRSDDEAYLVAIYRMYKVVRIILTIVYLVPLLLVLVCILSFILKWSKFRIAVLGCIYSLVDIAIFSALYFFLSNMIGYKISSVLSKLEDMTGLFSEDLENSIMNELVLKVSKCYWTGVRSPGFLITALLGVGILAISVIIMVMNKTSHMQNFSRGNMNGMPTLEPNPIPAPVPAPMPTPVPNPIPAPTPAPNPMPASTPAPMSQKIMGKVICTDGSSKGQGCRLPAENKLLIGTDPRKCSMVITGQYISGLHCSVRYNDQRNTYIVEDHSSNGTFVNGLRLPKDTAMEYPPGTTLVLADGSSKITLG